MNLPDVVPIGDRCLSIVFEEQIDPRVNAKCVAVAAELCRRGLSGVRDVVPTYHTVAVHFDPGQVARAVLERRLVETIRDVDGGDAATESEPVRISVIYGGEEGPDLASVAEFAGASEEEVVRLHTGTIYRAYMLGFLPGFAYLGSVNPRIAAPRLGTPRLRVAEGSVGIAGAQAGIYPCETPGGWRIIGRTPVKLFDSTRHEPSMLKAGDRVQFVAA
ncbi:MAG: 5-oxoprolinase subunit PxpB [Vicinamibacterales bacterium]|nr:5-oxoprolinase subunit PxpB [Vicinamibacterales bacterium]